MFTTYILIGGKSSRMGTDKASVLLKGETFIKRILNAVKPFKTPIKLVSSLSEHKSLGYQIITDIEKDKGPVSAITSALSDTKTALNLILSVDVPLLQYNTLEWLLKQHNNDYQASIICSDTKQMPLIGIYNKSCVTVFEKHLSNNQLKLMFVLEDLKVNFIEIPKKWQQQILNINTPEELKSVQV